MGFVGMFVAFMLSCLLSCTYYNTQWKITQVPPLIYFGFDLSNIGHSLLSVCFWYYADGLVSKMHKDETRFINLRSLERWGVWLDGFTRHVKRRGEPFHRKVIFWPKQQGAQHTMFWAKNRPGKVLLKKVLLNEQLLRRVMCCLGKYTYSIKSSVVSCWRYNK